MFFLDSSVAPHSQVWFCFILVRLRECSWLFYIKASLSSTIFFFRMLLFLWWPFSICLLKVFLDVRGIIAWSWKWANFFGRSFFINTKEGGDFFRRPFFITAEEQSNFLGRPLFIIAKGQSDSLDDHFDFFLDDHFWFLWIPSSFCCSLVVPFGVLTMRR